MRFLNHRDMALALIKHRRKLPQRIDLVVGVPRSGMIPATMLATQMNVPLVDADGFLEGRLFRHGSTKRRPDLDQALADERVVLIMDDVIGSGRADSRAQGLDRRTRAEGHIHLRRSLGHRAEAPRYRHHPQFD